MNVERYISHEGNYFSRHDFKLLTSVREVYAYKKKKYVYTIVLRNFKIEVSHKYESDAKASHANLLKKLNLQLHHETWEQ